ncbi:MAG TPA: pyridoxal-phosphate dependent enzyme, partial [Pseudonocardiaceae bacterium]
MTLFMNPSRDPAWTCEPAPVDGHAFHRALPGYAPTRLTDLPAVARRFGPARVVAKDESTRLGLPAFKALGASWAIHRTVLEHAPNGPVTIVTATDGNHGRAVAHFAKQFGHRAEIFLPDGVHPDAIQAIRDEGATVIHVRGNYDTAVRAAARAEHGLLVQDTTWDGYEDVPRWIVDGYATLFREIDDQLAGDPDLVIVPTGVGSLLQAALVHYRSKARAETAVVSVEPEAAPCVLASVTAGRPVTVKTGPTSMAGLNCGTVSSLAWPYISRSLDACVTVSDAQAASAARELTTQGVDAGPCGAASLGALHILHRAGISYLRPGSTVLLLITEGSAANPGLKPGLVSGPGADICRDKARCRLQPGCVLAPAASPSGLAFPVDMHLTESVRAPPHPLSNLPSSNAIGGPDVAEPEPHTRSSGADCGCAGSTSSACVTPSAEFHAGARAAMLEHALQMRPRHKIDDPRNVYLRELDIVTSLDTALSAVFA